MAAPQRTHSTPEIIAKVGGVWADMARLHSFDAPSLQEDFQREVAKLLKRNNPGRFPGAQPVSFAKQHIEELKLQDYYVCEKTDGMRFLMYMTHDGDPKDRQNCTSVTYLIDRKNDYYWIPNLFFPHQANDPGTYDMFHMDTILDGELVEDKYPDGTSTIKFLAFDLLVIDKKDLRERTLDKRLAYMKDYVLKPYHNWLKAVPGAKRDLPFIVEDKKTEFGYALATMFHQIIPQVKQIHGNDGLIFTCKDTPYKSDTDPHILKWKPPEENTVDFLMDVTWHVDETGEEDYDELPADISLYIYHGNNMNYSRVGSLHLTAEDWEKMKSTNMPLQNIIVECYLEDTAALDGHTQNTQPSGQQGKRWRFHRFREDKQEANHVTTFDSVKVSIEDHVTQQDLLDNAETMKAAWKARDARRGSRPQ